MANGGMEEVRGAKRGKEKRVWQGSFYHLCRVRERRGQTERAATVTAATKQRGFVTGGTIFVIIVTEVVHRSEGKKLGW